MAKKLKLPPQIEQHLTERRAEVAGYLEVAKKFKRKIKIAFYTELLKELDALLEITE